jgi:hypothetical protein
LATINARRAALAAVEGQRGPGADVKAIGAVGSVREGAVGRDPLGGE